MLERVSPSRFALRCDDGETVRPVSPGTVSYLAARVVLRRRQRNLRDGLAVPLILLLGLAAWHWQLRDLISPLAAWSGSAAGVMGYLFWSAGRERRVLRRDLEISR